MLILEELKRRTGKNLDITKMDIDSTDLHNKLLIKKYGVINKEKIKKIIVR